jgi:hypothetical protein
MANVRNSNTFYIDTQYSGASDELAVKNLRITHVIVTATAANGRIVLADSSVATKVDLRVATSGASQVFDFSANPLVFSTSVRPTTLTNAVATCIGFESRG